MMQQFYRFGGLALVAALSACSGSIESPAPEGHVDPNAVVPPGNGLPPGAAGAPDQIADPVPPEVTGRFNLAGSPMNYRVVRLTNEQWTNSVQNILALPTPPTNAESFQGQVSGTTDFTNNELVLAVDSRGWSDYQNAAESLAEEVTSDPGALSRLYPGTDAAGFIAAVGRRAYRRPLTPDETASYQQMFDLGASMSGNQSEFAKGAAVVLEAMLQSPYFIYRTELGEAGAPLNGYEMAAKLSLWLRNTSPDDDLLDLAAGPGQFDTPEGAMALAQTMLDEPAARGVMEQFHREFLRLGRFSELSKLGVPEYSEEINEELAESSRLFFDKIFAEGLGVKDVFLSTSGFVGPQMAGFYDGPAAAPTNGMEERELGSGRVGYFMQLPFLMLYAHNEDPDPIHRGVNVSLDVLCSTLGPPAAVVPPLPAALPGETNRQRVDKHTKGCGAECHNEMINPLGFAFENFDGMGQYRETERNGDQDLVIDASGSYEFVDGVKTYTNASELMQVLAQDEQTHLCYAKKIASFGLQRDIVESDYSMLKGLAATSLSSNGSVKQLILDLIKTDAFRTRVGGVQ